MRKNLCGALLPPDGKRLPGAACTRKKLPGFGACLRHLDDDDEINRAWDEGYRRCKSIIKIEGHRKGERCRNKALDQSDSCPYHLPKDKWLVPVNRRNGMNVYRVGKAASDEGIDVSKVQNPLMALMELAAEAMSLKDELKRRVVNLKEEEWRYEGVAGEQIRGEIVLYERALDRITRLLVTMTRLGIEERLARVEERMARQVEAAVAGALADTGLPQAVQDQAREFVGQRLRAAE